MGATKATSTHHLLLSTEIKHNKYNIRRPGSAYMHEFEHIMHTREIENGTENRGSNVGVLGVTSCIENACK